ncbi:hypothetical protein ES332_A05G008200v1 [Gossypium tomentosum]|uniref:NB-ARC domain-containing protein n=1 Tax=Gossypium tomentosum TaxID=34277 RepID=A0A5D2Q986_GOSTO|nr:hypothetical protein ES332_A05G008200v1 [Gossypium tomentosum]
MESIPPVTELLHFVIPYLKKQVQLIKGAPEQVQSLHSELQFIEKSLKQYESYDRIFMEDNTVQEWLTQIRSLVPETKGIFNTYKTAKHVQTQRTWPNRWLNAVPHVLELRDIGKRVEKMKKKIEEINSYKNKYCHESQVAKPKRNSEWLEKQRREVEEENVEGFEVAIQQVTSMLLTKALTSEVVSIVGTTGSDKTTLAKKIYMIMSKQFEHLAWAFVPSIYSIRDLLLDILKDLMPIGEETLKLDDVRLAQKLRNFLRGKKYLVVIDGVEETQLWETLRKEKVFPNENHGSRLLLTTRSTRVASLASSSRDDVHNMVPMDETSRWTLLKKLVFKDGRCYPELEHLGKQIATKCVGLPLAIVSLASLLDRDKRYGQWVDIISNVSWYLNQKDSPPCFGILDLTYHTTIPEHLRKCLLYLGAYPSGSEILARQVINLWVAEELVKDEGGSKAEKITWRYLEDLFSLSLIEVVRKRSDGGIRKFRIHEIWRMFCVLKSERIGFLQVHTKFVSHSSNNTPWRLSIHHELRCILSNNQDYLPNICTLLCFHDKDSHDSEGSKLDFNRSPCLTVLDVGSTRVSKVDENIKRSRLLKYLKLNHPSLNHLPRTLFSLPNLQTLDIKNTCVMSPYLPSGIWGMQNLRHLLLPPYTMLPKRTDQSRKCLWHLQTLSTITLDENTAALIFHSRFPSLIKLSLNSQEMENTERCLERLYKLGCLQKLKIINRAVFPVPMTFPTSLVKVSLVKTDLVANDVMRMLEYLDHLQVLKLLKRSIRGPELEMKPNSFPQLRFLFMEEILVKTWRMGDGAMGSLEELTITRCHELESLPKQLRHLHNIRQVKVNSPSQCLRRELEQLNVQQCEIQIHF